jgi:hypothetical protein
MTAQGQRICPLFGRQVPRVQVQLGKEGRAAGILIVRLIQPERPDWPEEDRASRDGWESFAAVGRVRGFSKGFGNNQCLAVRPTSRFASQPVVNILWLDLEQYSVPFRWSAATPCAR